MPGPDTTTAIVRDPRADARVCRAVLAAGSKSFAAAGWLLPARTRDHAAAFYAFCRTADDLVDLGDDPIGAIAVLHARLDRIFAGVPDDDAIERALHRTVVQCAIPRAIFDALLDGFAWDAAGREIVDGSDLVAYSARVASSIGVVMTLVMGVRERDALARACDLGVAMQLTNIARDVGEDARRGRVYLPTRWLDEAGIGRDELLAAPGFDARLAPVIERVLDQADRLYRRADLGVAALPRDCRPAIRAARAIYADIGRVIRARGYDVFSTRARTSLARKLVLLVRARLGRDPVATDRPEPLPETAFLVHAVDAAT